MGQVRITRHVKAPAERCFELAVRAQRLPEWNAFFTEVRDVSGTLDRVGAKFAVIMKVAGRRLEGHLEVKQVERPNLLVLSGSTPGGGLITWSRRFQPSGEGSEIVAEIDYTLPGGFAGDIADRLFVERAIERDARHSQENFAAIVEAEVPLPV